MAYRSGSHTTFHHRYHLVWAPKYRYKVLHGEVRFRVREIIKVSIRRGPPCVVRQRALLSVLLRVCFGAVDGSGDGVFGAGAAPAVDR